MRRDGWGIFFSTMVITRMHVPPKRYIHSREEEAHFTKRWMPMEATIGNQSESLLQFQAYMLVTVN